MQLVLLLGVADVTWILVLALDVSAWTMGVLMGLLIRKGLAILGGQLLAAITGRYRNLRAC